MTSDVSYVKKEQQVELMESVVAQTGSSYSSEFPGEEANFQSEGYPMAKDVNRGKYFSNKNSHKRENLKNVRRNTHNNGIPKSRKQWNKKTTRQALGMPIPNLRNMLVSKMTGCVRDSSVEKIISMVEVLGALSVTLPKCDTPASIAGQMVLLLGQFQEIAFMLVYVILAWKVGVWRILDFLYSLDKPVLMDHHNGYLYFREFRRIGIQFVVLHFLRRFPVFCPLL